MRTVVQHVVVVDGEFLSPVQTVESADAGDVPEHRVGGLPQLAVGLEAVLDLSPGRYVQSDRHGHFLGANSISLKFIKPALLWQDVKPSPCVPE